MGRKKLRKLTKFLPIGAKNVAYGKKLYAKKFPYEDLGLNIHDAI